jgi:hypothetical protein
VSRLFQNISISNFSLLCPTETSGRIRIQRDGKTSPVFTSTCLKMLVSLVKSSAEMVTRYLLGAGGTWLLGGFVIEVSAVVLHAPASNKIPRDIIPNNSLP